jgi:hypothetical protein
MAKKASTKHEQCTNAPNIADMLKLIRDKAHRSIIIHGDCFDDMTIDDVERITQFYIVDKRDGSKYGYITISSIVDKYSGEIYYQR